MFDVFSFFRNWARLILDASIFNFGMQNVESE